MLVYVVLQRDTAAAPCNKTVYGLLLPSANGNWEEVEVRLSMLEGGGWGLYPRNSPRLDWNDLKIPVLLPYLGLETVVQDAHMLKLLVRVLQGNFVLTQADEVSRANGDTPYVRDGLCAVPEGALLRKAGARAERLAGSTELLQVAHPSAANAFRRGVQTVDAGRAECCYLISEDAQRVLGLVGEPTTWCGAQKGGGAWGRERVEVEVGGWSWVGAVSTCSGRWRECAAHHLMRSESLGVSTQSLCGLAAPTAVANAPPRCRRRRARASVAAPTAARRA